MNADLSAYQHSDWKVTKADAEYLYNLWAISWNGSLIHFGQHYGAELAMRVAIEIDRLVENSGPLDKGTE